MTGFMSLRFVTTATTTVGRDSRTERKAGREGEMPGGGCEGPHLFTVCLITLRLSLYSDS